MGMAINEILEVSSLNHNFLMKRLEKNTSTRLLGKWVAVTQQKLFADTTSKKVLNKAQKIEPEKEKILIVKIPHNNTHSIRF